MKKWEDLQLKNIGVMDFVIDGHNIWLVSCYYNFLLKSNTDNWMIEEAYRIPFGRAFDSNSIFGIYQKNGKLVLLPYRDNEKIVLFDVKKMTFEMTDIVFPYEKWGNNSYTDDEYVYLPIKNKNSIFRIRKEDFSFEYLNIPKKTLGISVIYKVSDGFLMIDAENADCLKMDLNFNSITKIAGTLSETECPEADLAFCGLTGQSPVYAFPRRAGSMIKIDNKVCKAIGEAKDIKNIKCSIYTCVKENGGKVFAYCNEENAWHIFTDDMSIPEKREMAFTDKMCEVLDSENIVKDYSADSENRVMDEKEKLVTLRKYISSI